MKFSTRVAGRSVAGRFVRQPLVPAASLLGLLLGAQAAQAQAGKNGNVTLSATTTIVNEYAALTADAAAGSATLTVASNTLNANNRFAAALAPGDLVMVIQMQGATIDATDAASYGSVTAYNNAGRNEVAEVQAIAGTTGITLACNLKYSYSAAGRAQVVRLPRYATLALNAGATLTGTAWNGTVGGVVAAEVQNGTTINGTVSATGLGFRGGAIDNTSTDAGTIVAGYRGTDAAFGAEKGEGIVGYQADYDNLSGRYGRGAAANGGGGGNSHNGGGGGGANVGTGTWTGTGNPDRGTSNAYDPAWNLEGTNFALSTSSGGGRGGYTYSNVDRDALTIGPGNTTWGGNGRQNVGGLGGRPLDQRGRLYLGGGGGAGDGNNGGATAGGNGGGLIYLLAGGAVGGSGTLVANGTTGVRGTNTLTSTTQDAAGGGGGGGTIVLSVSGTITGVSATAQGGTGGSQAGGNGEAEGPGGGGGGGLVVYTSPSGTNLTAQAPGAASGTTTSNQVSEFPLNGGTRGGAGVVRTFLYNAQCAVADVTTTLAPISSPALAGQSGGFAVTFSNTSGTTGANDIAGQVQLPAGLSNVQATNGGTYDPATGLVTYAGLTGLAPNQTFSSNVTFTTPPSGPVNATSGISTTTAQGGNTNPDAASSSLAVTPVADVTTTLSGPAVLGAGRPSATYTATFTNNGPSTAASVVQTVTLPAGSTGVSAAGSQSVVTNGNGTVTITYPPAGTLASGASNSFQFTFTAPTTTGAVVLTSNTGTGTSQGSNSAADQFTLNATVTNTSADVLTTTAAANATIAANAQGQFNLTFQNAGPGTAPNAVRRVQLSTGLTNVTATGSNNDYNVSTGVITYPVLASSFTSGSNLGSTVTFTAPAAGGTISATTSISSDAFDPQQPNNSTSATITATPSADVVTTLTGPATAAAGTSLTYVATVVNNGPSAAASLVPSVLLPKALLNPALPSGASYDANTGIVTLPTTSSLAANATQSYNITFTLPNNNQPVSGRASSTATTADPAAANNNGSQPGANAATTVTLATGACSGTTPTGQASTQGLYAEYFKGYFADNTAFFNNSAVSLTRSETSISYATNGWGDITAAINGGNATNPDAYSARYRGYITITTGGSYTFTLYSDDAAYLWVGGAAKASPLQTSNALVNGAGQHGATTYTGTMTLAAGSYPLAMLYGENGGENVLTFSYNGPDTNNLTTVVPASALCSAVGSGPLPVVLARFEASARQADAILGWATAQEQNSRSFAVERSLDNRSFTEIGTVAAHGTSTVAQQYAYRDANAASLGGPVYYRLRQVDLDGTATYSPVRTVAFAAGASAPQLRLYPNPATEQLHVALTGLVAPGAKLGVYSVVGQAVLGAQLGAASQADLSLAGLPAGTYVLRVTLPDGSTKHAPFVKQ
jgi:uncharacterized repeat protein (TIGR01451 family)